MPLFDLTFSVTRVATDFRILSLPINMMPLDIVKSVTIKVSPFVIISDSFLVTKGLFGESKKTFYCCCQVLFSIFVQKSILSGVTYP